MSGMFYVAVVQEVLLYGQEMWMIPPRIGRILGGFNPRIAHRMTRQKPNKGMDRMWV